MRQARSPTYFTGRHLAAILIAFFALVIAVNILMATIAVRSFGGTVVDNSYVASQRFNGWLAQARAERQLGWRDEVSLDAARRPRLMLRHESRPVSSARIRAVAQHPLGRAADIALDFHEVGPGLYAGNHALPAGRWQIRFDIRHAGDEQHLLREID